MQAQDSVINLLNSVVGVRHEWQLSTQSDSTGILNDDLPKMSDTDIDTCLSVQSNLTTSILLKAATVFAYQILAVTIVDAPLGPQPLFPVPIDCNVTYPRLLTKTSVTPTTPAIRTDAISPATAFMWEPTW